MGCNGYGVQWGDIVAGESFVLYKAMQGLMVLDVSMCPVNARFSGTRILMRVEQPKLDSS